MRNIVVAITFIGLLWGDESASEWLRKTHETLKSGKGDLHDTYLSLMYGGGNEETMALLLDQLKFYGEPPHGVPPEKIGYICTQLHLVDAIRAAANTDKGTFYRNWAQWWEAHKQETKQQWVDEGFAERGLHPTNPPDRRFALELMSELSGEWNYRKYQRGG